MILDVKNQNERKVKFKKKQMLCAQEIENKCIEKKAN